MMQMTCGEVQATEAKFQRQRRSSSDRGEVPATEAKFRPQRRSSGHRSEVRATEATEAKFGRQRRSSGDRGHRREVRATEATEAKFGRQRPQKRSCGDRGEVRAAQAGRPLHFEAREVISKRDAYFRGERLRSAVRTFEVDSLVGIQLRNFDSDTTLLELASASWHSGVVANLVNRGLLKPASRWMPVLIATIL